MIPAYRPKRDYLAQTLDSVLAQDTGAAQMQIAVVDDSSPDGDTAAMVKSIAGERIGVSRTPKNLGLAGCWNTCIERARGQWVHLLHQDDYVLPGFYAKLSAAAQLHPEVSLLATRSFFVDAGGIISRVTPRVLRLENAGREVEDFFYDTPFQCPGVAVRRSFYEAHGGFRPELSFTLDCEMWSRVVGLAGGLVTPDVLACYRESDVNETSRLHQTARSLQDLNRLSALFAARYPAFDRARATRLYSNMAYTRIQRFSERGDAEAAQANRNFWQAHAPASLRARKLAGEIVRRLFG
jgi:glycosyltransferase involved in cell wall biosynthesis